jgi:hypothetical protein
MSRKVMQHMGYWGALLSERTHLPAVTLAVFSPHLHTLCYNISLFRASKRCYSSTLSYCFALCTARVLYCPCSVRCDSYAIGYVSLSVACHELPDAGQTA